MKNISDSDAIRAIIWQTLVDRANGRTPYSIQPVAPAAANEKKMKEREPESAIDPHD